MSSFLIATDLAAVAGSRKFIVSLRTVVGSSSAFYANHRTETEPTFVLETGYRAAAHFTPGLDARVYAITVVAGQREALITPGISADLTIRRCVGNAHTRTRLAHSMIAGITNFDTSTPGAIGDIGVDAHSTLARTGEQLLTLGRWTEEDAGCSVVDGRSDTFSSLACSRCTLAQTTWFALIGRHLTAAGRGITAVGVALIDGITKHHLPGAA